MIVTIILRAIVFALDIVAELPVLGFINRLAGGVVGLGCALIIVWVAFIIITMLYMTSIGKEAYELIQNNDIIKMIYDYNPTPTPKTPSRLMPNRLNTSSSATATRLLSLPADR